jgi:glycosyltransferase involved in cell wall biosynthesis
MQRTMKKQRIYYWIDHTAKYPTNTGMQRVARSLASALISNGCEVVFVRWSSERESLVLATQDELLAFSRSSGPQVPDVTFAQYPAPGEVRPVHENPAFAPGQGWLLVPEVTYITYHERPPTLDALLYARHLGLRSAFIFYDAVPLKLAHYATASEAHAAYVQQIAMADVVVPISEFAAKDFVDYLSEFVAFDSSTLPVVRPLKLPGEVPGVGRGRAEGAERDGPEIMILSVGSLEPRKNQTTLIEAFDQLCVEHPRLPLQLTLVGHLHAAVAESVLRSSNPRIHYLKYVQDSELESLYRRCRFTVYPSLEEGFGLPILESLWHGKPCVCADFGAMDEAARGGGCLQVDVRSAGQITLAMQRLVTDQGLWNRLAEEAVTRRMKTWGEYAQEVSALLEEISNAVPPVNRVLYWVDHTCQHPSNSGIQRVVRLLAKSLLAADVELVPVRWDAKKAMFTSPTRAHLEHLARWSGPSVEAWSRCDDIADAQCEWLLIPELTVYPGAPELSRITELAASLGMRSAILFYDTIPYKMSDLYPLETTAAHRSYMEALNGFHRVIAISETSLSDLREFWIQERCRLIRLDDRLVSVSLPEEFVGSARVHQYHAPDDDDVIRILSVGTIEPRKNHLTMIRAFLSAVAQGSRKAELTLVGSTSHNDLRAALERYLNEHSIIKWIDDADDALLRDIYSSCHFTVYPSLEEGFGLPIAESLWHGKPCVCRDQGALAEVARGGGCVLIDTANEAQLAAAIGRLIDDGAERTRLGREATARAFKTWETYGREVLTVLSRDSIGSAPSKSAAVPVVRLRSPLLSICITTYNRAAWLEVSLGRLTELVASYRDVIEVVVCDNASSDNTAKVAAGYGNLPGFRYYRNAANVGMLGNLRETAHHARGRFVWMLGDDDIVKGGSIEKILGVIMDKPAVPLVYLNYAYTHHDAPSEIKDLDAFLASGAPITAPGKDRYAPIADLATMSENFFTAIYCLVFRRDHAIRAYSQDVAGPPFSSLLTCVPTAYYVCKHMFQAKGYWIGEPCVVVNMNVSWARYAPLWVLERLPELYDLAEIQGAKPSEVDRWRVHNLAGALHFLPQMYWELDVGIVDGFSFERFVERHHHLSEFRSRFADFVRVYERAFNEGHVRRDRPPDSVRARFGL